MGIGYWCLISISIHGIHEWSRFDRLTGVHICMYGINLEARQPCTPACQIFLPPSTRKYIKSPSSVSSSCFNHRIRVNFRDSRVLTFVRFTLASSLIHGSIQLTAEFSATEFSPTEFNGFTKIRSVVPQWSNDQWSSYRSVGCVAPVWYLWQDPR